MKPCELQSILSQEWSQHGCHVPTTITPEARFITGNPKHDSQLHRILIEYGIELDVNPRFHSVEAYRVVDEKKFMWFLLRWS
jgi:hypothetical protein